MDEDTLVEAFLMAYEAGVRLWKFYPSPTMDRFADWFCSQADVITASIGGTSGWTDGPWATVASRLVDQGVVVTISSGNEGDHGPFYASNGSSGKNVLAVASIDTSVIPALPFEVT